MIEQLFLTGPSGLGKTTAILQLLPHIKGKIGGFIVQRVFRLDQLLGFCMTPAGQATQTHIAEEDALRPCFLTFEEQGLRFHPQQFSTDFLELTQEGDLIILDEIGGVELQIPKIRARIRALWQSDTPLLGVWKAEDNLIRMQKQGRVSAELLSFHDDLEQELQKNPQRLLLDIFPSSDLLLRFLQANGLHRALPGRKFCQERLQQCSPEIQRHSMQVARLTEAFAWHFQAEDPEALIQAALLHDTERHQKQHAEIVADALQSLGYPRLSSLTRHHMVLPSDYYGKDEALLWLADKCCQEDTIVHPLERFQISEQRYGQTETIIANLEAFASFDFSSSWQPQDILVKFGGQNENSLFSVADLPSRG